MFNTKPVIMSKIYFRLLILLVTFSTLEAVSAQSVVSITPDSALQGQTLNVVITGNSTNFGQGTNTIQVWLSKGMDIIPSNSVFVVNDLQLIVNFTIPLSTPTGLYDVNTYNALDGYVTLIDGFEVLSSTATGVQQNLEPVSESKIYPNPFSNSLKLEYTLDNPSNVQIMIFDVSGRVLVNSAIEKYAPGNYTYDFSDDIVDLPKGNYFVRLRTDSKDYNYKVIRN